MTQPQRIQLSRKRGFNLQAVSMALNGLPAVNCARPGKWGNPYSIVQDVDRNWCVVEGGTAIAWHDLRENAIKHAIELHRWMMLEETKAAVRNELRGHNLACWCGDGPCHADTLLELSRETP